MRCPACGSSVAEGARECPGCSRPLAAAHHAQVLSPRSAPGCAAPAPAAPRLLRINGAVALLVAVLGARVLLTARGAAAQYSANNGSLIAFALPLVLGCLLVSTAAGLYRLRSWAFWSAVVVLGLLAVEHVLAIAAGTVYLSISQDAPPGAMLTSWVAGTLCLTVLALVYTIAIRRSFVPAWPSPLWAGGVAVVSAAAIMWVGLS